MYVGLLLILLPLVLGYLVVLKSPKWLHRINQSCTWMVYVILLIMGISLSQLDNLAHNASTIFTYAGIFLGVTITANLAGLLLMDKLNPLPFKSISKTKIAKLPLMIESLTLLGVVVGGFLVGLFINVEKSLIDNVGEWALMVLLAVIGVQLRNSGIAMREILLNKGGMMVALVVIITSWFAGVIAGIMTDLPINQALAISSGFGWYSLSGILISDGITPVFGGVAFINDLMRELVAIVLIPILIKQKPYSGVGVGGATSMDFTLPIIQKSGGSEVVPMAIISGFILTLVSPIFMLLFLNM